MYYGLRFLPELSYRRQLTGNKELSIEGAANAFATFRFKDFHNQSSGSDINTYRLWTRIAADRYEIRTGLQKINFGSATLLRPLRWFDSVDPRDPLKLTDGVNALLGRIISKTIPTYGFGRCMETMDSKVGKQYPAAKIALSWEDAFSFRSKRVRWHFQFIREVPEVLLVMATSNLSDLMQNGTWESVCGLKAVSPVRHCKVCQILTKALCALAVITLSTWEEVCMCCLKR